MMTARRLRLRGSPRLEPPGVSTDAVSCHEEAVIESPPRKPGQGEEQTLARERAGPDGLARGKRRGPGSLTGRPKSAGAPESRPRQEHHEVGEKDDRCDAGNPHSSIERAAARRTDSGGDMIRPRGPQKSQDRAPIDNQHDCADQMPAVTIPSCQASAPGAPSCWVAIGSSFRVPRHALAISVSMTGHDSQRPGFSRAHCQPVPRGAGSRDPRRVTSRRAPSVADARPGRVEETGLRGPPSDPANRVTCRAP